MGCHSSSTFSPFLQGITTFDSADVYSSGESEVVLGKALKQHKIPRDEVVIMTKVYFPVSSDKSNLLPYGPAGWDERGYANRHGLSRKHIFEAIKASLERLQLDYVDVLQIHRFDYNTPIEETMEALHDVVSPTSFGQVQSLKPFRRSKLATLATLELPG
jgi:aryl-alcohol dehydrogenase-like predicted oxidoreductase